MTTRICIGIPTAGMIKAKTALSLFKLVKDAPVPMYLIIKEASLVHQSREEMAREVVESGCSHLLFIDSDMSFEPDAAVKLLGRDKDIIGASYNYREFPLKSTVKPLDKIIDGVFECEAVGTGFMLIKTEVFKKMPHPWFFFSQDEGKLTCGEDVWFCRVAREAGFKIWCDSTIKVGHIGEYIF